MKSFLITGGAGFIGGHLAASLIADGCKVNVIDDLSTGSEDNLVPVASSPLLRFEKGDVITSPLLPSLVKESDVVIHLAAAVGVELVVHDPVRTIMTNVQGTERLLKLSSEFGKRTIIASTSEVYGKSSKDRFSEEDDLLIGPPDRSRWSYACSKLLDEFMLMAYQRMKSFPGTVTRFFNTVGPRQTGRYGMVIPRFIASALKNEDVRVFGTGKQTRCFCHVADTVRAVKALAFDDEKSTGKVFNIGSNRSISMYDLAKLIIERTDSKSKIVLVPYSEAYEEGFEDMLHRAPDCTRMKKAFNWEAEISLEKIIDDVRDELRSRKA